MRKSRTWLIRFLAAPNCFWFASVGPCAGQQPAQKPADPPQIPTTAMPVNAVQEVGGRLVVIGETVVVRGNPDEPIRTSSIATKIDTPLLETPRSVSVTDRRTLDDLQAVNIAQAHDVTAGVTPLDDRGPASVRGFPVSFYDLRRDGLRTFSWSVREPAGIDRVQYLRGPAAVLYGDGSPGGLINLVVKKPLPVPRYEVTAAAGGSGFGRLTGDATGPVVKSGSIRYRFVAAAERLDNGFDNGEQRLTVYPMVTFDLGRRASLHLDSEWYEQRGRGYRHTIPATQETGRGDFSRLPWNLNIASPDDGWQGSNFSPGVRFDSRLGERSTLHVSSRYTGIDGDFDFHGLFGLADDRRTLLRGRYREISQWHEYQTDGFFTRTAGWGPTEHRLVVGAESGFSTTGSEIGISLAPSIDLLEPVYGPSAPDPILAPTDYDTSRLGVYAVDQVRVTRHLIVAPGVRWSRLRVENNLPAAAGVELNPVSADNKWSPSLGLVVLPRPWLSFYGSYARGFEPPVPGQYLENRLPAEPSQSASLEGGVKADIFGQRLSAMGSFFHIRQTNVAELDPAAFYRQIGEGTSDGLELELVGSLAPGLGVRAGYAFMHTEVTRDVAGFAGNELPNAPSHKMNLWMRYRFPGGSLARLTIAGGVVHVADRYTDRTNAVLLPAYTRLDATARYEIAGPRLSVGLSAYNLTDARYVTSGAGRVLWAGPPRRIALEIGSAF